MKFHQVVVGGVSVGEFASKSEADHEFGKSVRSGLTREMFSIENGNKILIQSSRQRGFPIKDIATYKE